MKGRTLTILLNPFVLAAILFVPLIIWQPISYSKYRLELYNVEHEYPGERLYYHDIDRDGEVEYVRAQLNGMNEPAIVIRKEDRTIVDAWNTGGEWCYQNRQITFLDYDRDGQDELYFFSLHNDTVRLNGIEPFKSNQFSLQRDVFIGFKSEYENDLSTKPLILADLNGDGAQEMIFSLNAGYAVYPRMVFAFDRANDTIWTSPYHCNRVHVNSFQDLDGDGSPELLAQWNSSGNSADTARYPCSDYKTYLTVLDNDLSFLFPPLSFDRVFSGTYSFSIPTEKDTYLYALVPGGTSLSDGVELLKLNTEGSIAYTYSHPSNLHPLYENTATNRLILMGSEWVGESEFLELDFLKVVTLDMPNSMEAHNLDRDPQLEAVGRSQDSKTLVVYQDGFAHPVSADISILDKNLIHLDSYMDGSGLYHVYAQSDGTALDFIYSLNPSRSLAFAVYPGIYLGMVGLFFLTLKGQRLRDERKRVVESEIAALQLKAIKNQVDPHFVFNAVNTVGAMVLDEDKEKADRFITRFSRMMRQTLQGSDKIATTLRDELEYVRNYTELQQIRYENSFEYEIEVEESIKQDMLIPKHSIFTYVENAIKHGLAGKPAGGELLIQVGKRGEGVQIVVEDNGIGLLAETVDNPASTGHGLKIMDEIFQLYQKLYRERITQSQVPLFDERGNPAGIRVILIFH